MSTVLILSLEAAACKSRGREGDSRLKEESRGTGETTQTWKHKVQANQAFITIINVQAVDLVLPTRYFISRFSEMPYT